MGTDVVEGGRSGGVRPQRAGAAALAMTAALIGTGLACGGGDDGGGEGSTGTAATEGEPGAGSAAGALAAAAAAEAEAGAGPGPEGSPGDGAGDAAGDAGADAIPGGGATATTAAPELPPPTFPAAAPPTTAPGTEPLSVPGANGNDPLFGQVVVDLEPGGYGDYAVQLRQGQHVQVLSSADDGILTHTEVFAPDGSAVGQWESGEPGSISGYYWDDDDTLPLTGTYIFRVRHVGGSHERFLLTFYGEA